MTKAKMKALIELYLQKAGVRKDRVPPTLMDEMINQVMLDFANETKIIESKYTVALPADQKETSLPDDVLEIKVDGLWLDGAQVHALQSSTEANKILEAAS